MEWRTDFLVQHYGEGDLKIAGCPELSAGVSVLNLHCVFLSFSDVRLLNKPVKSSEQCECYYRATYILNEHPWDTE